MKQSCSTQVLIPRAKAYEPLVIALRDLARECPDLEVVGIDSRGAIVVLDEDATADNITPLRLWPVDHIELDQNFSSPPQRGAVVENWARGIFKKQCVARRHDFPTVQWRSMNGTK
jgi:hypothetical protein